MELLLTVTTYGGSPPDRPASLRIGAGGCTLGRNPGNDLALSDPDRLVSGLHAQIELRPDGVWITDKSTNGTFLNHDPERLATSQPTQLHDGDILGIGPYEISVSLVGSPPCPAHEDDAFATGTAFGTDLDLPGMSGPGPAPDIMALLGGTAGPPVARPERATDPFADAHAFDAFLCGPAPEAEAAMAAPHPTPMEHVFFQPPDTQPIPDDYDLLGDLQPTPRTGPGPNSGAGVGSAPPKDAPVFHDTPSVQPPAVLDLRVDSADLTVPPSGRGAASASEATSSEPEPSRGPEPAPLERLAIPQPGLSPIRQSDREPIQPRDALEPERAASAPRIPIPGAREQAPPFDRPIAPTPLAAPTEQGAQSGLAALLAGLGTGDPAQIRDPESLLHGAGTLLRALVTGLTATMMVRARFKSELRVGMTTLRPTENNPFKFSVGAEEALERLLLRPNPGFLPPVQATQEAFDDIQAHEMAILAGLRAALRALLARFEPTALEARLDPASGFDKLLPMARKSRIWEQFTAEYGRVAADAEEDFMQLFGEAFTRAYEDQIYRLSQTRGQRPAK